MNKTQRRLVGWGAVVLAVVLHLSFCRWGTVSNSESPDSVRGANRVLLHGSWGYEIANPIGELRLFTAEWVATVEAERRKVGSRKYAGHRGHGDPLWSYLFGIALPLALVGAAGFVFLGGRKADVVYFSASAGG